jgi:D-alanyl-D-alanine carboxypeptidase
MRDHRRTAAGESPTNRSLNRRAMLTGAAGAWLGVTLAWPVQAEAGTATPEAHADAPFDPLLARRLQQTLEDAVAASNGGIPGTILYVEQASQGSLAGAAGLSQLDPDVAMRPDDRFGAGSVVKPFVAATVLQLVEDGAFPLDAALPEVLPADVTERFPYAGEITVRILLGHRSGLPEWNSPTVAAAAGQDLGRVWTESELLDLAAAQEPLFPPGTDYSYSNTNYTLLGLIIEQATGRSWRREVTDRVIAPLQLEATVLPAPGDRSLGGPHAHGYVEVDGALLDVTTMDPSMAGAAGGNALVTSAFDLVRFLDALLAGELFRSPETLEAMLAFQPASGEPGQVGYGLGLLQRVLPGGIVTIDHLGGAVGYWAYVARLPRQRVTLAVAFNSRADPALVLLPVLEVFSTPSR